MGNTIGAGDYIDIGAAQERRQHLLHELGCIAEVRGRPSLSLAAIDGDCSSPQVFLLIERKRAKLRTVKPRWDKGIGGGHCGRLFFLRLRGELAEAQHRQEGGSEDEEQAK